MKRKLLSLFVLISGITVGQSEPTLEALQQRFPSEKAAYLKKSEHVHISTSGNNYNIYADHHQRMIYLNEKGSIYAGEAIYFSEFTEIEKLKAYSKIPRSEGSSSYSKQRVHWSQISTEDVYNSMYFYHDQKKHVFVFPGTRVGTITDLQYREIYKNPKFLGSSFLISFLPSVETEYSITFPSNVSILYNEFNFEAHKDEIEFTKTVKGDLTTYTWKTNYSEAYEPVDNAPSLNYYAPHVSVHIGEIKLQDSTVTVLPDLPALYNWYYSLVTSVNNNEDSTLKAITQELVAGVDNTDEKARIIFNWVQDNIKYIAFEHGMGGFIPRQAAKVCRNRYGDCKDMSSIITDMLRYAGIDGNLTWIGSRDLPYKYTEVPTPIVDNHMIASYKDDLGKTVFLDAVGSYTPYGYPTGFIQGKQALVSIDSGKYEVHQVPIVEKERNLKNDSVFIKFEDGNLKGVGTIEAIGYAKLDFVYPLINENSEKRTERLQQMLEKGNNKFLIGNSTFEGIDNRDSALLINYDFTLGDYAKAVNDELFINMNLEKTLVDWKLDIEKRRGVAVDFDYRILDSNTVAFEIPGGYALEFIPENSNFESEKFGFTISYKQVGNQLIMTKKIYVNTLLVEAEYFEEWNNMVQAIKAAYKEVVILKKQ